MIERAPTALWMTYGEALVYCFFLEHNGYRDWRLPTKDEYHQLGIAVGWYTGRIGAIDSRLVVWPVRTKHMALELAPYSPDLTYDEAVLYCLFCNHDGHNDWRMPTREERDTCDSIRFWIVDDEWRTNTTLWPVRPVRTI